MVRDPKLVGKCGEIPVLAAVDMGETLDAVWPSGDSTAVIRRPVRIRGWLAQEARSLLAGALDEQPGSR
jgi:hypothetical protein